jgi:hypothetical protein
MKKLLIVPAILILSTGFAFAGNHNTPGGGYTVPSFNVGSIDQSAYANNNSVNLQLAAILQYTQPGTTNMGSISQNALANRYSANVQGALIIQGPASHVGGLTSLGSPF